MLSSLRSTLNEGTLSQRVLILGGLFFLISLLVDIISVDLFAAPDRPGTTLTRRSVDSYALVGLESLIFGLVVHYLEAKTRFLSFESSE